LLCGALATPKIIDLANGASISVPVLLVTGSELVLSVLLLVPSKRWVPLAGAAFGLALTAWVGIFASMQRQCGCLGTVELPYLARLGLALSVALLCALLVILERDTAIGD
jgi:hypothetical protein